MSKNSPQPQPLLSKGPVGLPQYAYHPVSYQTIAIPGRVEQVRYRRSPLRRFILAFLVAAGLFAVLKTAISYHRYSRHGRHRGWDLPANMVLDRCERASTWAAADAALPSEATAHSATRRPLSRSRSPRTPCWCSRATASPPSSRPGRRCPETGYLHLLAAQQHGARRHHLLVRGAQARCGEGVPDVGDRRRGGRRDFRTGRRFWAAAAVMKIQLVLPEGKTPLHLKGLSVNLPHFTVDVGHLKDAVSFESAVLRTSNAAVQVKSLSADDVKLHTSNSAISADSLTASTLALETSNGGISGTFNTSTHLHLSTSNAPINVSVGLTNANSTAATTLNMRTSNNRLDAAVTLATDGRFRVDGNTSNGVLALGVAGPVDAALSLGARTSNKRAEVALPDAFEGQFTVTTSQHAARVVRRDAEDGRTVEYGRVHEGHTVSGWVYAEEANRRRGGVRVTTSNAEAVLVV
ncbi:hypothetical protein B0H17DRAFT_1051263 [Mycena rosella]|uniref:DUF7330 domain-containing protein n=1 Tax=Mycena rosella TaxID=1033263 RepID=A0AAD7DT75_MYCRO|nr:hypothetical protein B0H17DRAFT_1051263 [Mycena rosella]